MVRSSIIAWNTDNTHNRKHQFGQKNSHTHQLPKSHKINPKQRAKKSHIPNIIYLLRLHKDKLRLHFSHPPMNIRNLLHSTAELVSKTKFNNHNYKVSEEIGLKTINHKIKKEWNKLWKQQSNRIHLRKIKLHIHQNNPTLKLRQSTNMRKMQCTYKYRPYFIKLYQIPNRKRKDQML